MSNNYFNADGTPAQYSRGLSSPMRNEFSAVEGGFDLLPDPSVLAGSAQNYYVDSGSVNNIVVSGLDSNISAWYDGMELVVKAAYTNTGTVQIVPGALAAKTVVDQSGATLTSNAFYAGQIISLRYIAASDKVQFVTTSDASAAASAASAAASAAIAAAHVLYISPTVRTSNTVLTNADAGKRLLLTGTFTQTFDTSGMAAGWTVLIRNNDSASGSSRITLPSVDGVSNVIMYPNEERIISYDGSVLKSVVIHPFIVSLSATETLSRPSGYSYFEGEFWGAGGGGGGGYSTVGAATVKSGGGGGAGGGYSTRKISYSDFGATALVTIGGGGSGGAANTNGSAGGSTSFASIITVGGGAGGNSGGTGGGQDTGSSVGGVPGGVAADSSQYFYCGAYGGASNGSSGTSSAGAGRPNNGGAGGGGGGETAANALWAAAAGGARNSLSGSGGAAGTSNSSAPTAGTAGGAFQGGGGGGSAQSANGANGGAGGTASGGGGGGATRSGFQGGTGGIGGNGFAIIWGVA